MAAHDDPNITAARFFADLSQLLQIAGDEGNGLAAGVPFAGPGDVLCCVRTQWLDGRFEARPELVLPISAQEIRCLDAAQLLTVQQVLLEQMQWWLGRSDDGLLLAYPMSWCLGPADVADQLDLGVAAANMVLALLRGPDSGSPTPPPPQ